jgi:heat shock protein HslJ
LQTNLFQLLKNFAHHWVNCTLHKIQTQVNMYKSILLLTIFSIISITAFSKRMNPIVSLEGKWKIKSLAIKNGKLKPFVAKKNEVDINAADSRISIYIGCNRINSQMSIFTNNKIKFNGAIMTRMGCPDPINKQETAIADALNNADSYVVKGKELKLMQGTKVLAVLTSTNTSKKISLKPSAAKAELAGSYRIIHQMENGVDVERNTKETTFTIDPKTKTYSANVGTNQINGTYIVKGDGITFKPGIMTMMGSLDEDLNNLEKYFVDNLKKIKKFKIEANHVYFYENDQLLMMLESK